MSRLPRPYRALLTAAGEWFHHASEHGPLKQHLHDDFYDDNGRACQPAKPVVDADLFPYPATGEWTRSVDFALDVAFSKWQLPQPLRTYRRMQPRLLEPPPASELATTVSTYANRDKVPRVKLAVDVVVKKADRLCRH